MSFICDLCGEIHAQTVSCEKLARERKDVQKIIKRHRSTDNTSSDPGDTETDEGLGRRGSMSVEQRSDKKGK